VITPGCVASRVNLNVRIQHVFPAKLGCQSIATQLLLAIHFAVHWSKLVRLWATAANPWISLVTVQHSGFDAMHTHLLFQ